MSTMTGAKYEVSCSIHKWFCACFSFKITKALERSNWAEMSDNLHLNKICYHSLSRFYAITQKLPHDFIHTLSQEWKPLQFSCLTSTAHLQWKKTIFYILKFITKLTQNWNSYEHSKHKLCKSPSSAHHKQIGDTEGQGLTAERFVFWPKLQMEPETAMPEFTIQSPRGNAKQIHHI